jgi:hypothetical protein
MDDTPEHIKKIQLQIWLSKPPMERLRQFLIDNEALYMFWQNAKTERAKKTQLDKKDLTEL